MKKFKFKDGSIITASTVEEAKAKHRVIASEELDLEKVVAELDGDSSLKQISPLNKAKSYVAYAYKYGNDWIDGSAYAVFWLRKKNDTISLKTGISRKSGKEIALGYSSSRIVTSIDEIKSVINAKKKLFDKAQLAVKELKNILSDFKK